MSTTAQHPTPNFGEPWTDLLHMLPVHEHRAIECVNACSGMADPAIEIQAMREAVKNANHFASIILAEAGKQWLATELLPDVASIEAVAQQIKDELQPFVTP